MVFYMPGRVESREVDAESLTPREIVGELDRFIVGQDRAKRSVAIALRNRSRRKKLSPEMAEEVMVELEEEAAPLGKGDSGKPAGSVEVFVDVEGVV